MRDYIFLRSFCVVGLALLWACTTPGAAQFEVYSRSFSTAFTAGNSILDRVSQREREVFNISLPAITPQTAYFDPAEARYLADNVDPPATASLRQTLLIVKLFNDSLAGLATGATARQLSHQTTQIGTAVVSVGLQATAPLSTSQSAIADSLATKTRPLRALEPLANLTFGQVTREEFRSKLLEQAPTIDALLVELINISGNSAQDTSAGKVAAGSRACSVTSKPSMFCIMIGPSLLNRKSVRGTRPFSADEVQDIEATRALLANWVVLLSATRQSLATAVGSVSEGRRGTGSEILASANELEVAARGVRTALAR